MTTKVFEYDAKIVVLGNAGAGKTCLIDCFQNGPSENRKPATYGPEYVTHKFRIKNKVLKACVWDTAGQERYRAINKTFYRRALGGLLVVDLSQVPEEKDLEYWVSEFKSHAEEDAVVMIVGSKADLACPTDTSDIINRFSMQNCLPFVTVSAKTGFNVAIVMEKIVNLIYDQFFNCVTSGSEIESVMGRRTFREDTSMFLSTVFQVNKEKKKECCLST